jgi:hypothetical protein
MFILDINRSTNNFKYFSSLYPANSFLDANKTDFQIGFISLGISKYAQEHAR